MPDRNKLAFKISYASKRIRNSQIYHNYTRIIRLLFCPSYRKVKNEKKKMKSIFSIKRTFCVKVIVCMSNCVENIYRILSCSFFVHSIKKKVAVKKHVSIVALRLIDVSKKMYIVEMRPLWMSWVSDLRSWFV